MGFVGQLAEILIGHRPLIFSPLEPVEILNIPLRAADWGKSCPFKGKPVFQGITFDRPQHLEAGFRVFDHAVFTHSPFPSLKLGLDQYNSLSPNR